MKANYYSSTGTLFITITVMISLLTTQLVIAQDWYHTDWEYRREVSVTNPVGSVLTDFQVQITLDGSFNFSNANADGSDIRVTDDDGISLLTFWVEYWDAGGSQASVWVKVSTIPISGTTLFLYYGNIVGTSLSDGSTTFEFFDDFEIDLAKWTVSGGTWTTVETTEQGGSTGFVAQGITTGFQILQSNGFSGTDYVLEGYGKQVSGNEWGLCSRVTGTANFYVCNLYDNHDDEDNLYNYNWMPATHPVIGKTALGPIITNNWYKMTVKVYDDTLSTSIDNTEWLKVQNSQHTSGGIALFGENGTNAQFNDIRVRKYASSDPTSTVGNEEIQPSTIGIAIFHTTCGDFEVKLRPDRDITSNYLTNIQFTIKWPANTVDLTNFDSDFGVGLQGVYVENDTNYAVFVSTAYSPINWTAGIEDTILSFSHDYSAIDSADFKIDTGTWAASNNGEYYIEVFGMDYTGTVYGNATNVYLGRCGEFKVLLQGTYGGGGMMNKGLTGNIPLSQPFNVEPWNYDGTESVGTIDGSVVDWILVELRSDENTPTEQKAALLLENGEIVQYNNITHGVHFNNTPDASSYYILIHHRNHMPVMTALSTVFDGTLVDFTDETICYGSPNAEIFLDTDVYGMIAGDINSDGYLSYSGPGNDRGLIIALIVEEEITTNINDVTLGYYDEDVLMDYEVKYIGDNNDRAIILTNLSTLTGTVYLNAIYQSTVPGVTTKSGSIHDGPIHIFLEETINELQVKINTDEDIYNGIVDNVQFTLSWEVASNDIIIPILEQAQSTFGLMPQGEAQEYEGKMYQVFVSVIPVELPNPFLIGDEVILVSFTKDQPIELGKIIHIANDVFTDNYNGAYYISLLGKDQTGTIQTSASGVPGLPETGLKIYPNPVTSGIVHLDLKLEEAQEITIDVLDIHAKMVSSEKVLASAGKSNNQIDLQHLTKGIYYIKVQANNLNAITKLILLK